MLFGTVMRAAVSVVCVAFFSAANAVDIDPNARLLLDPARNQQIEPAGARLLSQMYGVWRDMTGKSLVIDHYSGKLVDFEMGHQRFTAEFSEFSQRGKSVSFLVKSPIENEVRILLSQVPPLTGEPNFVITISANDSVGGRMYFVREVSASDRKKLRNMEPSNNPPRIASFPCYSAKGDVQNAICDNYNLGFMDYVYSLNVALRQQSDLKEGEERINPYEINKDRSDATNACSGDVKCLEVAYISLNNKICQAPIIFGKKIFNCLPLHK